MQPASRTALATARERLDQRVTDLSAEGLQRLGAELGEVVALLATEATIRRHLADSTAPLAVRQVMVTALLGDKVSQPTLDVLGDGVALRWSRPLDLVDAVEELARQALLVLAERDGSLEEVEDELFRFGRILSANSRLATLLGDPAAPVQRRRELLDALLAQRAETATRLLLAQLIAAPRRRKLDEAVEELVDRAAARRERSVAHVTAAGPLSQHQQQRLVDTLTQLYRRPISLKVELDPELLGGLVVRVGHEVIDGSIAGRLRRARQGLPR